jgi:NADH dehydrogenase
MLVRPGSSYQPLQQAGAQPIFGDLKERASLDAASDGVDVVITTANSALRGGDDNVETVDWQGNRNLIDAAQMAGVKHFIFVSALRAEANSPIPLFRAKAKSEEYLRASGVPYTILSPDMFMEVWVPLIVGRPVHAGLPVSMVGEGRRKHTFISVSDVAAFAIACIGHEAAMNQRLSIGGPEALSWHDVIATFERLLGRSVSVEHSPAGAAIPGLPEPLGQMVGQMMAGLEANDWPVEMNEAARTFDVTQKTLEEVVRGGLLPDTV